MQPPISCLQSAISVKLSWLFGCFIAGYLCADETLIRVPRAPTGVMCPRNFDPHMVEGKPKRCQPGDALSCPKGYLCNPYFDVYDEEQRFVCCGKEPGYCENGEVLMDKWTGDGKECRMDSADVTCEAPYACRTRNAGSRFGFCCRDLHAIEPAPIGCPWGTRALKQSTGSDMICTLNRPNSCPNGAVCYYDSVESTSKCCGKDPGEGCPSGTKPLRGASGQVTSCRPGIPNQTCPGTAVCHWSYWTDRYQCCEPDSGCPGSMVPLIDSPNQVRLCQQGVATSCPSGYSCEFNFWTTAFQCCGKSVGVCPANQVAYVYLATNTEQACPGGVPACPAGYRCQLSSTGQQICCGPAGSCPGGQQWAVDASDQPTSCSPSVMNSCTAPATCQLATGTVSNQYLCCKATTPSPVGLACLNGRPAYYAPQSTVPQQCVLNMATCPFGYECKESTALYTYICCQTSTSPAEPVCPPTNPSLLKISNQIQYCTLTNQDNCRTYGYTCLPASSPLNTYVCCGQAVLNFVFCPGINREPYGGSSSALQCVSSQDCPAGWTCQVSVNRPERLVCCQGLAQRYTCPANAVPEIIAGTVEIRTCTAGVQTSCGDTYTCVPALAQYSVHICCRFTTLSTTMTTSLCPSNSEMLFDNAQRVTFCSEPGARCSNSLFTCQQSPLVVVFICCRTAANVLTPACLSGRQVYDFQTGFPSYCNPSLVVSQCPSNHRCEQSVDSRYYVCCYQGQQTQPQCLSRRLAYIDQRTNQPRACSRLNPTDCPERTQCELASSGSTSPVPLYICCYAESSQLMQCPEGWVSPTLATVIPCDPNLPRPCQDGYQCVQSRQGSPQGFLCCGAQGTGTLRCKSGVDVETVAGTSPPLPRRCNFGVVIPQCGTGFSCQESSSQAGAYVCCRDGFFCRDGSAAALLGPTVQLCAANAPQNCPPEHSCKLLASSGLLACCRDLPGPMQFTCFDGSAALMIGAQPEYCNELIRSCQRGYDCKKLMNSAQFACCLQSPSTPYVCNDNTEAAMDGTSPLYCVPNAATCRGGYRCKQLLQSSVVQPLYACCRDIAPVSTRCPDGSLPYQIEGQIQPCDLNLADPRALRCPSPEYACRTAIGTPVPLSVCCRTSLTPAACSNGGQLLSRLQTCNRHSDCTFGYQCDTNTDRLSRCCSVVPLQAYGCLNGLSLALAIQAIEPMTCNIYSPNCPTGYLCQQSKSVDSVYYCCMGPQCPAGRSVVYLPQPNGQPRYCQRGAAVGGLFGCSEGDCLEATNLPGSWICCRLNVLQPPLPPLAITCLDNHQPQLENGQVVFCGQGGRTCLLPTYDCTSRSSTGQYICCSVSPSTFGYCPFGMEPYVEDRTAQFLYCKNTNYACPEGFRCSAVPNNPDQFICCKQKPTCQRGWQPEENALTKEFRVCNPSDPNSCTAPYKCQLSTLPGRYLCCTYSNVQWEENPDSETENNRTITMDEIMGMFPEYNRYMPPLPFSSSSSTRLTTSTARTTTTTVTAAPAVRDIKRPSDVPFPKIELPITRKVSSWFDELIAHFRRSDRPVAK